MAPGRIPELPLEKDQPKDTGLVILFSSQEAARPLERKLKEAIQPGHRPKTRFSFGREKVNATYLIIPAFVKDSIANIFSLTLEAHRAGWQRLLFFDTLSTTQLNGKTRDGISAELSLVFVGIDAAAPTGRQVIAKRVSAGAASKLITKPKKKWVQLPKTVEAYHKHDEGSYKQHPQTYYEAGVALYDPQKPLFDKSIRLDGSGQRQKEQEKKTADKTLNAMRDMPPEVAEMIVDAYNVETKIEEMTSAPKDLELKADQLEIHVLGPMSSETLKNIEDDMNEELRRAFENRGPPTSLRPNPDTAEDEDPWPPRMSVKLHPWRAVHPATRLDVWKLFERYYNEVYHFNSKQFYSIFLYIYPPSSDSSRWALPLQGTPHRIGLLQWKYNNPPLTAIYSLEYITRLWHANTKTHGIEVPGEKIAIDPCEPATELLLPYSRTFYWNPPPFIALDPSAMAPPVFMLTKHLTAAERKAVFAEIETMDEDDDAFIDDENDKKKCAVVEWTKDEDGGEADIWRLSWEVAQYRGFGSTHCCVFVDRESAGDLKVILSYLQYTMRELPDGDQETLDDPIYGPYTGVMYGRLEGRKAHISWCNLDIANMGFGDFFDDEEVHRYFRPGVDRQDDWEFLM